MLVLLGISRAYADTPCLSPDTLRCDTVCTFTEKILFPRSSAVVSAGFADNKTSLDSIRLFLSATDFNNFLSIRITGSHSPEGKYDFNTWLAKARASALADIVKGFNPSISPVPTIEHPAGGSVAECRQQRFAELQVIYRDYNSVAIKSDTAFLPADNLPLKTDSVNVQACPQGGDETVLPTDSVDCRVAETIDIPVTASRGSFVDRLFISNNLLYDAVLTPNIGAGIKISDRFAVCGDWVYARWNQS